MGLYQYIKLEGSLSIYFNKSLEKQAEQSKQIHQWKTSIIKIWNTLV